MSTTDLFKFTKIAQDGAARAGLYHTPHGDISTPIFAPVGTQATVKSVTPAQLQELGASLVLSNTYHLYLRPGAELVAEMGGLHRFMNWPGPILSDSGGFQIFSLAGIRKIDADGATFKSHIDGSTHRLTPEKSIDIQQKLGADIIMAFDECAPPEDRDYNEQALRRTTEWAQRCLEAKTRPDQAIFGIVQGGIFPDLRAQSAEWTAIQPFDGLAIGGLSVGESKEDMHTVLDTVIPLLPEDKPRYLMGVGSPEDLVNAISRGVDIFDCVLPTRLARHQSAMTLTGRINMLNAKHARDPLPIDESCGCYTCVHFSRAYIRHLIAAREMLASTLISIHNLYTLLRVVGLSRDAIIKGCFAAFAENFLSRYNRPLK